MHLLPLLLSPFLACPAQAEWQMDRFMISVWGCPSGEETALAFSDAAFNTVMGPVDRLDLCARHGLRLIVRDAVPEQAAALKDHPAVWGWLVQDEPKAEQFPDVGARVAAFQQADPNHPAYVNLMAWMDLGDYLQKVRPWFLSYDYYQWWWGEKNHFGRLEAHRRAALDGGIPLICWVEANADKRWEWGEAGQGYLPDNEPKLRQSVYTALAYGVKGIQWFNDYLVFDHGAGRTLQTTYRQSGEDTKRLNLELRALGPELMKLSSVAVYHTEPLPEHTTGVPPDLWLQCLSPAATLGMLSDAEGTEYAMVVNRDIASAHEVRLHITRPGVRIAVFDRESATWQETPSVAAGVSELDLSLRLSAGDGRLLRFSVP